MIELGTLNRFRVAPVNSQEIKFNLYAPIEKINHKEKHKSIFKVYEDDEFIVNLQGKKLTQVHRDIIDIIMFYGRDFNKNDLFGKTISLYEIQKHLQYKSKNNNKWIKEKLQELKRATIEIIRKGKNGRNQSFEISILRATLINEETDEYAIIFEEIYLMFFELYVSINYKKLLKDILSLKNAVTKSAIRYLLTFKQHQINVDKLLERIGIVGSKRNIEIHRKKLLQELQEKGKKFGIEIIEGKTLKDYIIRYKKPQEVKFYYPTSTN
jgi:hypothetical protein